MNLSGVSGDSRAVLNARIALMRQRRQGVDIEANVNAQTRAQYESLQERAKEIVSVTLPRLNESREQINALTERAVAVLTDAQLLAANAQKLERLAALKTIQKNLSDAVPEMKKNLEDEKKEKAHLNQKLEEFRQKLKQTSSLNCLGVLDQISERGSYRIATGRNQPISKETRGDRINDSCRK